MPCVEGVSWGRAKTPEEISKLSCVQPVDPPSPTAGNTLQIFQRFDPNDIDMEIWIVNLL